MKTSPKFFLLVLGLGIIVGSAVFFMAGDPAKPASQPPKSAGRPTGHSVEAQRVAAASPQGLEPAPAELPQIQPLPSPAPAPAPAATSNEQILTVIQDAAVSYSAAELPKIQPYLLHPDPEVRAAALQGMITLGDPAAAPMLRAASQLAITPQESAALREAATYLELPPGTLLDTK